MWPAFRTDFSSSLVILEYTLQLGHVIPRALQITGQRYPLLRTITSSLEHQCMHVYIMVEVCHCCTFVNVGTLVVNIASSYWPSPCLSAIQIRFHSFTVNAILHLSLKNAISQSLFSYWVQDHTLNLLGQVVSFWNISSSEWTIWLNLVAGISLVFFASIHPGLSAHHLSIMASISRVPEMS